MNSVRGGGLFFKAELVAGSHEIWMEHCLQNIFEDFADNWRDCYAAVVVHIAKVSLTIFNYRNNCTTFELEWYMAMLEHLIKESLESIKENERRIEEVI